MHGTQWGYFENLAIVELGLVKGCSFFYIKSFLKIHFIDLMCRYTVPQHFPFIHMPISLCLRQESYKSTFNVLTSNCQAVQLVSKNQGISETNTNLLRNHNRVIVYMSYMIYTAWLPGMDQLLDDAQYNSETKKVLWNASWSFIFRHKNISNIKDITAS